MEMLQKFFADRIFLQVFGLQDLWIYCHFNFVFGDLWKMKLGHS